MLDLAAGYFLLREMIGGLLWLLVFGVAYWRICQKRKGPPHA